MRGLSLWEVEEHKVQLSKCEIFIVTYFQLTQQEIGIASQRKKIPWQEQPLPGVHSEHRQSVMLIEHAKWEQRLFYLPVP